jgi:hypothetical protein
VVAVAPLEQPPDEREFLRGRARDDHVDADGAKGTGLTRDTRLHRLEPATVLLLAP